MCQLAFGLKCLIVSLAAAESHKHPLVLLVFSRLATQTSQIPAAYFQSMKQGLSGPSLWNLSRAAWFVPYNRVYNTWGVVYFPHEGKCYNLMLKK